MSKKKTRIEVQFKTVKNLPSERLIKSQEDKGWIYGGGSGHRHYFERTVIVEYSIKYIMIRGKKVRP